MQYCYEAHCLLLYTTRRHIFKQHRFPTHEMDRTAIGQKLSGLYAPYAWPLELMPFLLANLSPVQIWLLGETCRGHPMYQEPGRAWLTIPGGDGAYDEIGSAQRIAVGLVLSQITAGFAESKTGFVDYTEMLHTARSVMRFYSGLDVLDRMFCSLADALVPSYGSNGDVPFDIREQVLQGLLRYTVRVCKFALLCLQRTMPVLGPQTPQDPLLSRFEPDLMVAIGLYPSGSRQWSSANIGRGSAVGLLTCQVANYLINQMRPLRAANAATQKLAAELSSSVYRYHGFATEPSSVNMLQRQFCQALALTGYCMAHGKLFRLGSFDDLGRGDSDLRCVDGGSISWWVELLWPWMWRSSYLINSYLHQLKMFIAAVPYEREEGKVARCVEILGDPRGDGTYARAGWASMHVAQLSHQACYVSLLGSKVSFRRAVTDWFHAYTLLWGGAPIYVWYEEMVNDSVKQYLGRLVDESIRLYARPFSNTAALLTLFVRELLDAPSISTVEVETFCEPRVEMCLAFWRQNPLLQIGDNMQMRRNCDEPSEPALSRKEQLQELFQRRAQRSAEAQADGIVRIADALGEGKHARASLAHGYDDVGEFDEEQHYQLRSKLVEQVLSEPLFAEPAPFDAYNAEPVTVNASLAGEGVADQQPIHAGIADRAEIAFY